MGLHPFAWIFSQLLRSVSLIAGDGGGDDDGFARLRAFNSSGIEIARDTEVYPANFGGMVELSVTRSGISYIISDTFAAPSNLHSLGWDNVTAIPVPEPSAIAQFGVMLLLLSAYRRTKV
jgi:hypothetical protein